MLLLLFPSLSTLDSRPHLWGWGSFFYDNITIFHPDQFFIRHALLDKWKGFHTWRGSWTVILTLRSQAVVSSCTSHGKADGVHCIVPSVNFGKERIRKRGTHHLYSTILPLPFWNNDTTCQKHNSFTDHFGNSLGTKAKAEPQQPNPYLFSLFRSVHSLSQLLCVGDTPHKPSQSL